MNKRGNITPSRFADVMTAGRSKTDKFGQTAKTYAYEVALERMGVEKPQAYGVALEWGVNYEFDAIQLFQEHTGLEVGLNDVIHHPTLEFVSGTPDGLIGDDAIIEVKCPYNPVNHLANLREGAQIKDYYWQIQGYLWLTGRAVCWFVSYDPRFPEATRLAVHKVGRNQEDIDRLAERVVEFEMELVRPLLV